MTYTRCHATQKRRARRGDRPLERAVVATKSWVSPEQRQTRRYGEKGRKNKRTNKRNKGTSPPQSAARQGCQRKSEVRNRPAAERAAMQTGAFPPTHATAAAAAAAPLFLRFLSLTEVSAPPLPPSPPPEDTPRRSSLSLLRF